MKKAREERERKAAILERGEVVSKKAWQKTSAVVLEQQNRSRMRSRSKSNNARSRSVSKGKSPRF